MVNFAEYGTFNVIPGCRFWTALTYMLTNDGQKCSHYRGDPFSLPYIWRMFKIEWLCYMYVLFPELLASIGSTLMLKWPLHPRPPQKSRQYYESKSCVNIPHQDKFFSATVKYCIVDRCTTFFLFEGFSWNFFKILQPPRDESYQVVLARINFSRTSRSTLNFSFWPVKRITFLSTLTSVC